MKTIERKLSPPGTYLFRVAWNARPGRIAGQLGRTVGTSDERVQMASQLLKDDKTRAEVAGILSVPHRPLSPERRLGVALFGAFGARVDDDVFDGENGDKLDQVSQAQALAHQVSGTDFTFDTLRSATLSCFDSADQDRILSVADGIFNVHAERNRYVAGEYDAGTIWTYRERTTVPYVSEAAELTGILPQYRRSVAPAARAVQMWDDAQDLSRDAQTDTANLVLGVANTCGDLDQLQAVLADGASAKEALIATPRTRFFYRKIFENTANQVDLPLYRTLLRGGGLAVI